MKILFIGSTRRGYLTLKALVETGASLAGVISLMQHEHEVERFEEPIRMLAASHRILHYQTKAMKDRDYARLIADEAKPDVAIVVGCRILLPKSIYTIPPLGTLAVHDSLLPNYRGFAPLNWALLNGEKQTGVTLFYLDDRMDGGDIVGQRTVDVSPNDTAPEVYERVCQETVRLVLDACRELSEGRAPRVVQDYEIGSFTCSRTPADGVIDWGRRTIAIYDQVRALSYPFPGAFTFLDMEKLFVWKAVPVNSDRHYVGRIPGRVIDISVSDGHVDVLTGDGILRILEVQREGQAKSPAAAVIKSIRSTLGLSTVDLFVRMKALERQLEGLVRALAERDRATEDTAVKHKQADIRAARGSAPTIEK